MPELLPDDYLHFALYDAMRGVRLPALKRALAEDERKLLAEAIFARIKQAKWEVVCERDSRSAHSKFAGRGEP